MSPVSSKYAAVDESHVVLRHEDRPELEAGPAIWGMELVTMLLEESLEASPGLARRVMAKLSATFDAVDAGGLAGSQEVSRESLVLDVVSLAGI